MQLLTRRPGRPSARALIEGGNLGTGRVSLFGGGRTGRWRYSRAENGSRSTVNSGRERAEPGHRPARTHRQHPRVGTPVGTGPAGYQADKAGALISPRTCFSRIATTLTRSLNTTAARQGAGEIAGGVGAAAERPVFGGTQQYHQTSPHQRDAHVRGANRDQNVHHGRRRRRQGRPWGRHTVLFGGEGRYVKGSSNRDAVLAGRSLQRSRLWNAATGISVRAGHDAVSGRLTVVLGAHGDTGTRSRSSRASGNRRLVQPARVGVLPRWRRRDRARRRISRVPRPDAQRVLPEFSAGNTRRAHEDPVRSVDGGDVGVSHRGHASARVTGL